MERAVHPFGFEEENSLEQLFSFFVSCLRCGEWELARACVLQLTKVEGTDAGRLQDFLRVLVTCPYGLRWETVGSPHRLAWLWLKVSEKWAQEQVALSLKRELEFLLLLEELGDDIPVTVLKDLHRAFVCVQAERRVNEVTLSKDTESWFQVLLERRRPRLAQHLARFLQGPGAGDDPSDGVRVLQDAFVRFLLMKLEEPVKEESWGEELCSVLAVMPWGAEHPGGQLEELCGSLWKASLGTLREECILSSLLRPQCHAPLYLYCSTAVQHRRERLLESCSSSQVDLSEAGKLMFGLCCHGDRASAWRAIYFECLDNNKHFLEQVLVTALDLIKREDFPTLKTLLTGEFQPLSRLLLLLGWTHCQNVSSAKKLLETLHHSQALASDTVLKDYGDCLSSQLGVLDWCARNSPGIPSEAYSGQLHTLDSHSALYILQSLTPLAQLEERKVLELLLGLSHSPRSGSAHPPDAPCLSVRRNVVLFQGFCAMKYALYAICINAHKYSGCRDCSITRAAEEESKAEQDQSSAFSLGCSLLFQHYLSECQLYLETVPAMFRLELLENIFSLLFLSSSDFVKQERDEGPGSPEGGVSQKPESADFGVEMQDSGEGSEGRSQQPGRCRVSQSTMCVDADLSHFVQGCRGFLVDAVAMEGFLKLLRESLEGVCVVGQRAGQEEGRALPREEEVAESLGCSVTAEMFGARLQRLSKCTAEAHWRLQIVTSNHGNDRSVECQTVTTKPAISVLPLTSTAGTRKRRKKNRRHRTERHFSAEQQNGEVSTSTSDGGGGGGGGGAVMSALGEHDMCPPHSWLVPAMLSPPESLLISCIRRGNFLEAHQVSLMFSLEGSAWSGELMFMERYHEVLNELSRVEQTMENQVPDGSGTPGCGRRRLGSSGRSTLQAIGSAAAAGMAFYSISDVADRLLSLPARSVPFLEDGYWLNHRVPDASGLLCPLLEELSSPAMATFDLACCHCQLWKTSRQLMEMAERKLHSALEGRGQKGDSKVSCTEGIRGFPSVLQQISKILNHTSATKGASKAEASEEGAPAGPFGCSAQDVLLCSHPVLSEDVIAARLSVAQHLELTLRTLSSATDTADGRIGGGLLSALVEQANLKASELDSHPVRSQMKQLLRFLDQLSPNEHDGSKLRPDYMRSFLDYINTLAAMLVRSLGSEDQTTEVKLGNPLLVLLQTPTQLLSHLLFDRQVSPARASSLLEQETLGLNVQQVIVQRCCETLPVWDTCCDGVGEEARRSRGLLSLASVTAFLQRYSQEHLLALGPAGSPADPRSDSDGSPEEAASPDSSSGSPPLGSASSSGSPSSLLLLLTPSALSFLKSRSPLVAALACLSACRGGAARSSLSWPGLPAYFRGSRKEGVLDMEQVAREAETLLKELPVLQTYLLAMALPVLGPSGSPEEGSAGSGLAGALCGKPLSSLVLSGLSRSSTCTVATNAFHEALTTKDLDRALSLLELYGEDGGQEEALRDRLLACTALEDARGSMEHVFQIRDADLRARVTLRALERWPLVSCLELLWFCLSDSNTDPSLRVELESKKRELQIYDRMLGLQPPLPWATWQEVKAESGRDPEAVFSTMLEADEFELCSQWVQLFSVSAQLRLQLQTKHLLHLLEMGETEAAFQLLESLDGSAVALDVCEHALDCQPGLAACHFLADYLTLHFQNRMSPTRRRHIHALHLGSKVLLTLPPGAREDYFPLLSNPLLMLEQMLMNLKVDWASIAVATLRSLLLGQECVFRPEDVDTLLASYGRKALEIPYTPRERTRSDSVISLQDALLQCPAQDSCSSSASTESPPITAGSTPVHTPTISGGRRSRSTIFYTPPEKPPSRKDWIPDHQQSVCMICHRERFTMFNRRHHCRRCGRLVCQACSSHRVKIEGLSEDASRICDQCYSYLHPTTDDEQDQAEAASPPLGEAGFSGLLSLPELPQRQYRLSANPAENTQLQGEFYYEQAPSASLCIAILSLHSDHVACGHQLIDHCRSLSRGLMNPEVDARLLTDIMRQLLFSAKLMFVKAGQNQDLALCDSYISKVDVLKILVTANYKYIPSLDDILESAAVARLRNQLLESEYYKLAVEVSTKSGLDPSGVWQAWGMACLKAGNLSVAREKLARCLKAPVDRNQLSQGSRLLQEIVQHLESLMWSRRIPHGEEDILASLRELEDLLADSGPMDRTEGLGTQSFYYQDCLYYLHNYGTHLAIVSFYMRHDDMKEALLHIHNKECQEDVFLEGILQPSLEKARLGVLQGLLEALDPGLESWSRYLMASCQLLQRRGHFHTLYQLQQFMMDHVRAAMTCIRFFTHGAKSYLQLGEQQRWLVRAKEHLRTYLQEQQGRATSRRKSPSTFRKKMSSNDVSRHMNTIELQLEVTRFLHRCESSAPSRAAAAALPAAVGAQPSTLFGGSHMKIDVACKVMLGGKNIEEGFGIAYRVIQDFQLEALEVYVRAGQRLVRQCQYGAVRQLLKCVGESGTATKSDCDNIVLNCVSVADKGPADAKELESLILESKNPENKIKAYLLCSKLRAAYLLAVKLDQGRAGPLVQEVMQAAESAGDSVMQDICRQWLTEHQGRR